MGTLKGIPMTKKVKPTEHWCGTCQQLRELFRVAAQQIDRLTPEQKAEFRRAVRRSFGLPEPDTEFLKRCGIDPEG